MNNNSGTYTRGTARQRSLRQQSLRQRSRRIGSSLLVRVAQGSCVRVAMGVVTIAAAVLVAPSASQSVTLGQIATPESGVAGMVQSVSVIAPGARTRTVSVTATQGPRVVQLPVAVNRTGVGRIDWAPPTAGTWIIDSGLTDVRPAQVAVSAMPTKTQVAVPTNSSQHYPTPIIATVEASDPEAVKSAGPISGKVVFTEVVRGVIGEAKIETASDGTAVARLDWTPPGVAMFAVTAQFVPGSGGAESTSSSSGPFAYGPSSSPLAYFTAGIDRSAVQLLMPQVMRVGDPAYVVVHVNDERRGFVSLEIDGRKVSLDKPLRGDIAEFAWTPVDSGLTYVRVIFHEVTTERIPISVDERVTDVDAVSLRHYVEQTINVLKEEPRNPLSVSPVLKGKVLPPWNDDEVVEYPAASRVPLVSSTGNGLPVVYRITGSCAISGETLLMPITGGGCLVSARSPGGGGFQDGRLRVIVSSPVE